MIDPKQLLTDLQKLLKRLEPDIRNRCESNQDIDARLRAEYDKAKLANRTAQAYEVWREDYITQVAVAWILGCVFVRFLEDNRLIDTAWLAGANDRLQLARDQHTLYLQTKPTHSDREYLEYVFREIAKLPSMRDLLDGSHNPISKLGPTGDGATELLEFWQKVDPSTGVITHDFTDPNWSTRFLGDLYQDLSESARDRYALLQTPEFVEEFILSRTLTPAVAEFGYATLTMIDPACGSGHFLLGGFQRLLDLRLRHEPGVVVRSHVQAALGQVFGVDVNPFAAAIARFRLLVAALKACDVLTLADSPGFKINIAVGDSLLHGPSPRGLVGMQKRLEDDPLQHYYDVEDAGQVRHFLMQRYHVVVGNPPYITVRDAALNKAYRLKFASCYKQYSLAVPFKERFFSLAFARGADGTSQSGFVGMITANSFMKREFGKRLVEQHLPRWDLTHIIDTSGAFIPGHGTPTVILIGRNRPPLSVTLRAVMGIRGEPSDPIDPAHGQVWSAIVNQIDRPGSTSEFVSVIDAPRSMFERHPWSIGGGGAAQLKSTLDDKRTSTLDGEVTELGFQIITGEDNCFAVNPATALRKGLSLTRPLGIGENTRDWQIARDEDVLWATAAIKDSRDDPTLTKVKGYLWPYRQALKSRKLFGTPVEQKGLQWWELREVYADKLRTSISIAYPEIASHNHFVLAKDTTVFNQTAPVIKLPAAASVSDHLAFLGLLNSSTACFWMKQVAHQKQMTGGDGVCVESRSKVPYQFSATQLGKLPIPKTFHTGPLRDQLIELAGKGDQAASEVSALTAVTLLQQTKSTSASGVRSEWQQTLSRRRSLRSRMVWLQEEIDFTVYAMYELVSLNLQCSRTEPPEIDIDAGQRSYEMLSGTNEDGFTVPEKIPATWPNDVRSLWRQRMEAIQDDPNLKLIEDPHYKRRWIGRQGVFNHSRDTDELESACKTWMQDELDSFGFWCRPELNSCAKVAESLNGHNRFRMIAELYRGRPDFEMAALITELVEAESVPFLPVLRYNEEGLDKRKAWERIWEMQRHEDTVDAETQTDSEIPDAMKPGVARGRKVEEIGDIPVTPKYDSKDFRKQSYWSLRGKLDVPKERFVSFPFCERDGDPTPVIAWAGWDHLQLAQAIAAYYERVKNYEGWTAERRVPLLVGILELLPWLKQWHNEIHAEYHERMGDFFQQFVEDEARAMEMTLDQIRGWTPPVQSRTRGRKKRNT